MIYLQANYQPLQKKKNKINHKSNFKQLNTCENENFGKQNLILKSLKINNLKKEEEISNFLNINLGLDENYSFSSIDKYKSNHQMNSDYKDVPINNNEYEFEFENNDIDYILTHKVLNSNINKNTVDNIKCYNYKEIKKKINDIDELNSNESINLIYIDHYKSMIFK